MFSSAYSISSIIATRLACVLGLAVCVEFDLRMFSLIFAIAVQVEYDPIGRLVDLLSLLPNVLYTGCYFVLSVARRIERRRRYEVYFEGNVLRDVKISFARPRPTPPTKPEPEPEPIKEPIKEPKADWQPRFDPRIHRYNPQFGYTIPISRTTARPRLTTPWGSVNTPRTRDSDTYHTRQKYVSSKKYTVSPPTGTETAAKKNEQVSYPERENGKTGKSVHFGMLMLVHSVSVLISVDIAKIAQPEADHAGGTYPKPPPYTVHLPCQAPHQLCDQAIQIQPVPQPGSSTVQQTVQTAPIVPSDQVSASISKQKTAPRTLAQALCDFKKFKASHPHLYNKPLSHLSQSLCPSQPACSASQPVTVPQLATQQAHLAPTTHTPVPAQFQVSHTNANANTPNHPIWTSAPTTDGPSPPPAVVEPLHATPDLISSKNTFTPFTRNSPVLVTPLAHLQQQASIISNYATAPFAVLPTKHHIPAPIPSEEIEDVDMAYEPYDCDIEMAYEPYDCDIEMADDPDGCDIEMAYDPDEDIVMADNEASDMSVDHEPTWNDTTKAWSQQYVAPVPSMPVPPQQWWSGWNPIPNNNERSAEPAVMTVQKYKPAIQQTNDTTLAMLNALPPVLPTLNIHAMVPVSAPYAPSQPVIAQNHGHTADPPVDQAALARLCFMPKRTHPSIPPPAAVPYQSTFSNQPFGRSSFAPQVPAHTQVTPVHFGSPGPAKHIGQAPFDGLSTAFEEVAINTTPLKPPSLFSSLGSTAPTESLLLTPRTEPALMPRITLSQTVPTTQAVSHPASSSTEDTNPFPGVKFAARFTPEEQYAQWQLALAKKKEKKEKDKREAAEWERKLAYNETPEGMRKLRLKKASQAARKR